MPDTPMLTPRDLRGVLARSSYDNAEIRIADANLIGFDWLVSSSKGLFALSSSGHKTIIYGWFFGLCLHDGRLYLYENCGHRDRDTPRGRLIMLRLIDNRLTDPQVIATGLDCHCHQLVVIDGCLCLVDTANQAILRFDLEGNPIDVRSPFPPFTYDEPLFGYHHINAVASIGERIAVMLHNGRLNVPSALAWLDRDWRWVETRPLPGTHCHDIVQDEHDVLWHSDSMAGDIFSSDGRRVHISDDLMTRGIAMTSDHVVVGVSTFGPRHVRDTLQGFAVIFDRSFDRCVKVSLPGSPADIIAVR